MAPRDFTKSERKKLRELAGEAYSRELHEALGDLDSAFSDWRASHIDGFQLSDFIHEFHDGISRDLYSLYNSMDSGFLVARAVARRLLARKEVPPKLLEGLAHMIEYFAEVAEEPDA